MIHFFLFKNGFVKFTYVRLVVISRSKVIDYSVFLLIILLDQGMN